MKKILLIGIGAATMSAAFGQQVFTRAALGGTDFIDWGQFGPDGSIVTSPSAGVTNGGMAITLATHNATNMYRFEQGTSWGGNFLPGERLISNDFNDGGIMIVTFANPVAGVGAQMQRGLFGTFSATIALYDSADNLIASYTREDGVSNTANDGSAIFMGALATGIRSVRIYDDGQIPDYALNQMDIVLVPEPGTMLALAAGLAWTARGRKRR